MCDTPASHLTPRETAILIGLARGYTAGRIAREIGVRVKTVYSHRCRLVAKLGNGNVADLTRYAIRQGLVGLQD